MWDFVAKYRAWIIVVVTLAIPAATVGIYRGKHGRGPVDRVLIQGMATLQTQGVLGLEFVEELWRDYVALRDLRAENEKLRAELARHREERTRLIGVLQENARLRELLEFKERRPDLKLRPARVIGRDVTPFFRVLRVKLDARTTDFTVKEQMAVVSAEGVVGQVVEVYDGFADIMLVADPRSRVDVMTQRTRTRGMVHGLGHSKDYEAQIAYLRRKDEITEGDAVVTSGKGGVYPAELVVGSVSEVGRKAYGLEQKAVVEPSVDFSRLEEVFIVTGERARGRRP
jgi:rod shape-determining protein MreC